MPGTINLPPGPYCATSFDGTAYHGVTAGVCPVVQPPTGEPPGRQRAASIKYPNVPTSHGVRSVDLSTWDALFGHRNDTDALTPWPGALGTAPAIVQFTGTGYVALEFTPTRHAQIMVNVSSYNGAMMDGAWSMRPGDFAAAETRGPGESFQKVSTDPSKPGFYIPVDQRAYLNLRLHVPQPMGRTVQLGMQGILYP